MRAEAERFKRKSHEEYRIEWQKRERTKQDFEVALAHFQASNFPRLIKELASVIEGMFVDIPSSAWDGGVEGENQLVVKIKWGNKKIPFRTKVGDREQNLIEIITNPEGTIQVKGRLTITLLLNKWRGRADVQESALEQAYRNPGTHTFFSSSPMDIASGGGYGMS